MENTCEVKDRKEGYKVGEGVRVTVLQSKLLDEKPIWGKETERAKPPVDERVTIGFKGTRPFYRKPPPPCFFSY